MLTTYQREHLLPAYEHHAPQLYPRTLEASRAHVVMLSEQGLIPQERAVLLLGALQKLRSEPPRLPEYDGTFEDVYFAFERKLAEAAGIDHRSLDVQLARSRNDLDAGIFRMILRDQLTEVAEAASAAAAAALAAADRTAESVIIGLTHRRPAQPTTLGHVLAGYAEALVGAVRNYDSVLDELQASPLGSCAFAGTDLPIAPERVASLLGFDRQIVNSYEAVAGADHLLAVGFANARALATGARLVRLIQDWMTWGWIDTPAEFCQGSSIMPQKRNPVVLEHMVSMAGMESADAASVVNNISSAWWEDSNNATTDVQVRLWESNDRARRFFTLMARLLETMTVLTLPAAEQLVDAGTTTTAAADVLSRAGVPFRAAHDALGTLIRAGSPSSWTPQQVSAVVSEVAPDVDVDEATIARVMEAARNPRVVLERAQSDGPGSAAVRSQVATLGRSLKSVVEAIDSRKQRIAAAASDLDVVVDGYLS